MHDKTGEFEISSMGKEANKEGDIKEYVADSLAKKIKSGQLAPGGQAVVIGGTVWDWYKVRKELKKSWDGIDMLIIDEGSQVNVIWLRIVSYFLSALSVIVKFLFFLNLIVTSFRREHRTRMSESQDWSISRGWRSHAIGSDYSEYVSCIP